MLDGLDGCRIWGRRTGKTRDKVSPVTVDACSQGLPRMPCPALPLHYHDIVRASTTSTSSCHWLALDPDTTFSFVTGTVVPLVAAGFVKSKLGSAKHHFRPLIDPRTPPPPQPRPNATLPAHSFPNADHGNSIPPGPCLPPCGDGITKKVTPRDVDERGEGEVTSGLQVGRVPYA